MALLYALCLQLCKVLPLAREWIEIARAISSAPIIGFSLLRGSGLKCLRKLLLLPTLPFSLLRGSGLKWLRCKYPYVRIMFSLLRGSGLKFHGALGIAATLGSPSCEGVD